MDDVTAPGFAAEPNTEAADIAARIAQCQAAIRAMQEGRYDRPIAVAGDDSIGQLGVELNRLADALDRKFREATLLLEIAEEITSGVFLDDMLDRVYDSFRPVIPYNRIGCGLLYDENRMLSSYWARSDAPRILIKRGYSAPMADSSLQHILKTGRPRILNDLGAYLAGNPHSVSTRAIVEEGMRSSLTCPLSTQGKPVGFLFFSSTERNAYRDAHEEVFMRIAGQVAALIEKSRLYEQLYDLNQKLVEAQGALVEKATHDALTGILNRGAIVEELTAELTRSIRRRRPLGIVLVDVDHFKQFNDMHGHLAGDGVLHAVATRLHRALRSFDHVGRYGGEEFLIVLAEVTLDSAVQAAERLRLAVSQEPVQVGDTRIEVTLSAGVAVADDPTAVKIDQLILAADEALYAAKRNGRNCVEVRRL